MESHRAMWDPQRLNAEADLSARWHAAERTVEVRPWGSWQVIDVEDGYKVKRIEVRPGCRLSYQTHAHRSEHWVVVRGRATCLIDGVESEVGPGHSVDVPLGAKHRLGNNGDETLVVIEVQRGAYTGEDDIVRLDDDYGRCEERYASPNGAAANGAAPNGPPGQRPLSRRPR